MRIKLKKNIMLDMHIIIVKLCIKLQICEIEVKMYIDLSVRNLFSFGEKQTFSFEAYDKIKDYEKDFIVEIGKYKLLKMLMIYGANASGKTNILKCYSLLNELILDKRDIDHEINSKPFLLDPVFKNQPSTLIANFLVKKKDNYIRYKYEINFTSEEIINEKLEYYPTIQPALVFERKKDIANERGMVLKVGSTISLSKADREVILANTLKNNTVLSVFNRVNPLFEQAKDVWEWYNERSSMIIDRNTFTLNNVIKLINENVKLSDKFRDLLIQADFNISNIQVENNQIKFDDVQNPMINILSKKNQYTNSIEVNSKSKTINQIDLKFQHTVKKDDAEILQQFSANQESAGTLCYFGLLAPFYSITKASMLMLFDEIENSLHYDLQKRLLLMFLKNSSDSQLIVTTHNPLFLAWDIMRYDVIWFAEKRETGQTELFSLIDFNNLKRENVMKKYLIGNYGAVPNIKKQVETLE